ncbi:AAA family ATPase [Pseudomonas oryzihabitans]|uniref:AAA family ATPase n=1 Tax=Pseudomonas oryzihabitans TaxID=47885 RepID=UPI0025547BD7|nr:AAA family ATPase [Pseudomonas oryzihabitans]MDK8264879.1 AAA family ATPase [Pseudomonas oryzihabitans]
MEFDESHELVRALADEIVGVAFEFPKVPASEIPILAALHLVEGLEVDSYLKDELEYAFADVPKNITQHLRDKSLRAAFVQKLKKTIRLELRFRDRQLRLNLATYLIDLYITKFFGVPYGQPKAVAAVVGSIHATLRSPVIELAPTTAEISMGKRFDGDSSFQMASPDSPLLKGLISIKLIINNISPNFLNHPVRNINFRHCPSLIFESRGPIGDLEREDIAEFCDFTLDYNNEGRFILVIPAFGAKLRVLAKRFSVALNKDLRLDAVICVSVTEGGKAYDDRLILIFSRRIREIDESHVYIDVSTSNKALEHLDLQERAILAGHIVNIHEGRYPHVRSIVLPFKVRTILNAQFPDRYHDIKTLCIRERVNIDEFLDIYSPKAFIKREKLKGSVFNSTADPQAILALLAGTLNPACIYIIGNNGSGKTRLLSELIGRISESYRKTVGISTGVHDRFPFAGKKNDLFKYMGVRTSAESISPSRLTKNVSSLVAKVLVDQRMLDALKECQQCLGFATRFYFTRRAEMALGSSPSEIRPIGMSDDAAENAIPEPLSHYEFGLVRLETEEQSERIVSYSSLSSGEQNVNQLLLNIITTAEQGTVFLIDEPEISLHLKWQQTLPRMFHLLSQRFHCSFVVATHAPTLVSNANDEGSHSFMLDTGKLIELNSTDRYSVESIILDGFGTYTPHNRAVHEACARIVAMTMQSDEIGKFVDFDPLSKLDEMEKKLESQEGRYVPPGQKQDIDLIRKTQEAIRLLISEKIAMDSDGEVGAFDA